MKESPRVRRAARRSARILTSLGLCALLSVNGVPVAAWAARAPAGSRAQPIALWGRALPPAVRARLARRHALLASSMAAQDPGGCGVLTSDAARFLEQATFGPSFATNQSDPNYPVSVTHVACDVGFEGWLQEQFNAPVVFPDDPMVPNIGTNYYSPYDPGVCDDGAVGGYLCWSPQNPATTCTNNGSSTCNRDNYTAWVLQNEFFVNALTGVDQLRQRVAWALTQIDVVSETDAGIRPASWMVPYLQLFDRNAFGNYRQALYDFTVNPAMGEYLNMRGNTKQNVNENYAREILQLFSIGLNQLDDGGTVQLDDNANPIPTYDQNVITAFARVFTGWNLATQIAPGIANYRDPMFVPNQTNHDSNPKTLLDGQVVNDAAVPELNEALDNIFNHHNVGPFIGKQLIQKMVTSNPSPGYVQNVTSAFNTGCYIGPQGTTFGDPNCNNRGNMQALIAAVLLDPEARTAPDPGNQTYGHLREPVLFITNTLRSLGIVASDGSGYTTDFVLGDQFLPGAEIVTQNVRMDQDVFRPATVFSYFPPDNQLQLSSGLLSGSSLIAPEFGIQSTSTSLARINIAYEFAYKKMPAPTRNRPRGTWIDTTPFEQWACVGDGCDATPLIDGAPDGSFAGLNLILMHGNMTQTLHDIVLTAVQALPAGNPTARVQEAIYLIASSSQYQVER